MAKRRMFSMQIVDSDAFLDMPISSQLLYFHLSMRADDEGFIGNPKRIMRMIGVQDDDLKVLLAKRFILPFESGVVVIKHWLLHNTIKMDRFSPTVYRKERIQIGMKKNKSYTESTKIDNVEIIPVPERVETKRKQNGTILDTQVNLSKANLSKFNNKGSKLKIYKGMEPIGNTLKERFGDE